MCILNIFHKMVGICSGLKKKNSSSHCILFFFDDLGLNFIIIIYFGECVLVVFAVKEGESSNTNIYINHTQFIDYI